MEVIFIVALATVGVGSFAIDSVPGAQARASTPVMREVAAATAAAQGAAPMALLCTPKSVRRT
jgi:hypothetical protein